jgi:hypothetical protein
MPFVSNGSACRTPVNLQPVLGRIAAACGQDEAPISTYLRGDDDAQAVIALAGLGEAMGIGGVPCFVFNRSIVLPGAQSSAELGEAMHQCLESMQAHDRTKLSCRNGEAHFRAPLPAPPSSTGGKKTSTRLSLRQSVS